MKGERIMIRFGAPLPEFRSPEEWVRLNRKLGYNAAYVPVDENASESEIEEYLCAARENDIVLAEVGAWSNLISPDPKIKEAAIEYNIRRLALAERVGARCCVDVSGSKGSYWCGSDPGNYAEGTYEETIEVIQRVIDAVKPEKTYYSMEFMQWAYPDSTDCCLRMIRDVDRERFAVHLDPVNILNMPEKVYKNGEIIRDAFARLGPMIRSCHAKDVFMDTKFLVHISEIRIGLGSLDYSAYLTELAKYPEVPLMLEHLDTQEEYRLAADQVRLYAKTLGLSMPQPQL